MFVMNPTRIKARRIHLYLFAICQIQRAIKIGIQVVNIVRGDDGGFALRF